MSDRDAFRAEQQARRDHGLRARHEIREARAVRKAVVREVEAVIEKLIGPTGADCTCEGCRVLKITLRQVREIGSRDPE